MLKNLCRIPTGLVLIAGLFVTAQAGHAEYPRRSDPDLVDLAGILRPTEATRIREVLAALEASSGVEAMVVTIGSYDDFDTGDLSIESFATRLFNIWGLGDRERNDGVLVLLAVADRQVRIEVGAGYGSRQDANMQRVIDLHMVPDFRLGELAKGLVGGVEAIGGILGGAEMLPRPGLVPKFQASKGAAEVLAPIGGFVVVLGLFLLRLRRSTETRAYSKWTIGPPAKVDLDSFDSSPGWSSGYSSSGGWSSGSSGGGSSSGGGASGSW